jgi:hypothetical protein
MDRLDGGNSNGAEKCDYDDTLEQNWSRNV